MRNPGWIELQTNGAIGIDFSDPELEKLIQNETAMKTVRI